MLRNYVQAVTRVMALVGVVGGLGALGSGCLDRNVVAGLPTTKTNFTNQVSQSGIDKVDILFDIDNSASMGDKQSYLVQAIPQMIARLVTPRCVDNMGNAVVPALNVDANGKCSTGAPEFAPVHDMHLGVVTSALGSRLGVAQAGTPNIMVCDPTATTKSSMGYTVSEFNDDQGHLINRASPNGSGAPLAEAGPSNFLYWFPPNAANTTPTGGASPITQVGAAGMNDSLVGDFTELVGGAGQSGCGIESQLESWYRFLIQPDPYQSLMVGPMGAEWVGVDQTIIQQRHDFLRPDSLVAIIVLTDENDSEIDVRSYQGTGYQFMSQTWNPPHGSTACSTLATSPTTGPNDPNCKSCGFDTTAPGCSAAETYTANNDWGENLNLRHVHMKAKYGLDPQFPLTRYYVGLTSKTVPNREGEYPSGAGGYVGNPNCTNPLFAASLPTGSQATMAATLPGGPLCTMMPGLRSASDVFYAHIGGVPHELLQAQVGVADSSNVVACPGGTAQKDCPQKDELTSADWVKILGQGPASYSGMVGGAINYDYTGIDPHMIESYLPRTQLSAQSPSQAPMTNPPITAPVAMPGFTGGLAPAAFTGNPAPDPINGREWTTNNGNHSLPVDRQYACIFQLPIASQRDCSTLGSAANTTIEYNSCDCTGTADAPDEVPPLCAKSKSDGSAATTDYTVQQFAKAYPTIRELMLANMMGPQGIVSSLCPIHTNDNATNSDPLYGYRPAVNAIVNRLKSALAAQCVPKLTPDPNTGFVPCLILVTFDAQNTPANEAGCDTYPTAGPFPYTSDPTILPPNVLQQYQANQHATWEQLTKSEAGAAAAGKDPSLEVTCALKTQADSRQGNCVGQSTPEWCYITGSAACASTGGDALAFSSNFIPNGATVNLQCITANAASGDGG